MEGIDPRAQIFVVSFGVLILLLIIMIVRHGHRRRKGLAALAADMGFAFQLDNTPLIKKFERFRLIAVGSNQRITNVLHGPVDHATCWLFDYSFIDARSGTSGHGGKSTLNQYTVCVLCAPDVRLPYFFCRYKIPVFDKFGSFLTEKGILPGFGDIKFLEDETFSKKFALRGKAEEAVRRLFDTAVRQHLMRIANGMITIEGEGDSFLFSTGGLDLPKVARESMQQASELFTLLAKR